MKMEREFRAAVEQRVDDEARAIEGYAALFDSRSVNLGGFTEVIQAGAFSRALSGESPIFAYWNHNSDFVLGSTRSNTLQLSEDSKGLRFRLDASRLTEQQLAAVRDGDMRMSFGFAVPRGGDAWNADYTERTLTEVDLHEVSPVSQPAYEDTSAALRSLEDAKNQAEQARKEAERKQHDQQGYLRRKAEQEQRFRSI